MMAQVFSALTSEIADSSNRHDWLHTMEYRRSNVPVAVVVRQRNDIVSTGNPLIDAIDVPWIVSNSKDYLRRSTKLLTAFIQSFSNDYEESLTAVLADVEKVNTGDEMLLQIRCMYASLKDRILNPELTPSLGALVVQDLVNKPIDKKDKVSKYLGPSYMLLKFCDSLLYATPVDEEREFRQFHEHKVSKLIGSPKGATMVAYIDLIIAMFQRFVGKIMPKG